MTVPGCDVRREGLVIMVEARCIRCRRRFDETIDASCIRVESFLGIFVLDSPWPDLHMHDFRFLLSRARTFTIFSLRVSHKEGRSWKSINIERISPNLEPNVGA